MSPPQSLCCVPERRQPSLRQSTKVGLEFRRRRLVRGGRQARLPVGELLGLLRLSSGSAPAFLRPRRRRVELRLEVSCPQGRAVLLGERGFCRPDPAALPRRRRGRPPRWWGQARSYRQWSCWRRHRRRWSQRSHLPAPHLPSECLAGRSCFLPQARPSEEELLPRRRRPLLPTRVY